MSDLIAKLSSYVRAHDRLVPQTGSGALGHAAGKAEDIIGQFDKQKSLTDKQWHLLESICNQFETYLETSKRFNSEHGPEFLDLYEQTMEQYKACPKNAKKAQSQAAHTNKLKTLREYRVVYPYHIKGLEQSIKFLESKTMDISELKERATELRQSYWDIFTKVKSVSQANKNSTSGNEYRQS